VSVIRRITRRWRNTASPIPPYEPHAIKRCSGQRELKLAELLDRGGEPIAGLEPHLLLLRIAGDHAFRRAGEDNVAPLERHVSRVVADELPAIEHHVAGARGLAHLAVDAALDLQIVAVGEIGGDEPRPDRGGAVQALAQHPLARAALQIARREVVAGAVAEDVAGR